MQDIDLSRVVYGLDELGSTCAPRDVYTNSDESFGGVRSEFSVNLLLKIGMKKSRILKVGSEFSGRVNRV